MTRRHGCASPLPRLQLRLDSPQARSCSYRQRRVRADGHTDEPYQRQKLPATCFKCYELPTMNKIATVSRWPTIASAVFGKVPPFQLCCNQMVTFAIPNQPHPDLIPTACRTLRTAAGWTPPGSPPKRPWRATGTDDGSTEPANRKGTSGTCAGFTPRAFTPIPVLAPSLIH